MTQLIPPNAPTILPGGQVVTPTNASATQPGTRVTPRTPRGSGVYGGNGSVAIPTNQPVRDYVVRLVNEGSDFRMRYLTVEYFIASGDELIVPWEVMVSFLGSPETQNLGPRRMDRKNVYEQLRVKYGAYYDDTVWEENKPKLAAYRVTGEKLITVVDDPEGMAITPSSVSQQTAMAQATQIEIMRKQLEATTQLLAQLTGQSKSPTYQDPPPDSTVPFSTEGVDPNQTPDQMAPLAPTAPDYDPSRAQSHTVPPSPVTEAAVPYMAPMPPPPVPGMTPQMPIPVTSPSAEGVSDSGAATPDMPSAPVRIG